jgi:hypothetical protein
VYILTIPGWTRVNNLYKQDITLRKIKNHADVNLHKYKDCLNIKRQLSLNVGLTEVITSREEDNCATQEEHPENCVLKGNSDRR